MKQRIFLIFFLLLAIMPVSAQQELQLQHLDSYFKKAMHEWNVPGMAIAIVKNEEIIFQKGYGFADIESGAKVDENTLFAIASNTKAFTSTALALLVEEGKLNWRDKVIDHLDYFRMSDPYVTLNMTVEDLLCHRSGLVTFSGDLIWYGSNKNAEEVVKAAAYLKPEYGFREQYGYSNIMYIAAGLIIEKISGQSWAEFIRQRFLDPLKMGRTLASTSDLANMENVASPYYYFGDKIHKLEWINWDNVVAAGGLISSVKDMSQWLILNLNQGSFDYYQLFDASSFEKLTSPYVNLKLSGYNKKYQPSMNFKAYGLGWSLMDLYGKKVISHGGGYDGMISKIWLAPEDSLGMVILTNSLSSLPSIIMDKSLDVLLGNNMDGTDFSGLFKEHYENQIQGAVEKLQDIESQRGKVNPLHLNLEDYTGSYYDPMYGRVEIELRNGQLYMNMLPTDIFHSELKHWNDHIFTFKFPEHQSSLPMGKLWFTFDAEAKINALKIEVDNPDFDFMEFEFIKSK